jgi:hypothetical protein
VLGLWKLAQERIGYAMTRHADARIHGDDTVRAGDDEVEVKPSDLWQVVAIVALSLWRQFGPVIVTNGARKQGLWVITTIT